MGRTRVVVATTVLVALGAVPLLAAAFDEPYYVTLFTRILVFGLAALGLNLVLGYGAMVSFGHAMYMGIGAYAVGILGAHDIGNGYLHVAAALGVGTAVALVVGAICLRTTRHGLHHDHAGLRADAVISWP